jgi:hypothetical protein
LSSARNRLSFRVSWIRRRSGQLGPPFAFGSLFSSLAKEEVLENQERPARVPARMLRHAPWRSTRQNATRGPGLAGRIRSALSGVSAGAFVARVERPGSADVRVGTGRAASRGDEAARPIKLKAGGRWHGVEAWGRSTTRRAARRLRPPPAEITTAPAGYADRTPRATRQPA